jgi:hypothetical protein
MIVSGCFFFFRGGDNPRPDTPDAIRPAAPEGAASWSSLEWRPVTFEQPVKTSEEQWDQATAVAAGPAGWVAVGSNGDVTGYESRIWQSADSLAWTLVANDLMPRLELVDVAAIGDSYVAIGTNSADPNDPTTSILHSSDGVSWSVVESVGGAWASRVASGPQGFAVVIQVNETNDLLLSGDGRMWDRLAGADVAADVRIADIAWDGEGWIAAGSAGNRAAVLRSDDGLAWVDEPLPASEPVEGILDVSAYRVIPGRWATLVLGLDRGPSCAEDDDWCDMYQAAWSWTAETGWMRLPRSNWLLDRGYGVDAYAAGDAGFVYVLGDEVRTSPDGWEWTGVRESSPSDALASDVVVTGDRMVAVGTQADGEALNGWFGSAQILP